MRGQNSRAMKYRTKKEAVWKFHTASWPVRESNPGLRRERASSWPLDQQAGIEATRFELATSASRTQRSTKLSHASMFLSVCFVLFTSDPYILSWLRKKCKRFFEKISIFPKKFFRRIFRVRRNPRKALFYKEKQRLKNAHRLRDIPRWVRQTDRKS